MEDPEIPSLFHSRELMRGWEMLGQQIITDMSRMEGDRFNAVTASIGRYTPVTLEASTSHPKC